MIGGDAFDDPRAGVVESLGGTPSGTGRPPASPVRALLPPRAGRYVGALDTAADRGFERLRGSALADGVFYGASAVADFSILWHAVATLRALGGERQRREARRLTTALALESVLVNGLVKALFRRTRPVVEEERSRWLRQPRSSSFPSGHASAGFLAATLLTDGRRAGAPLWYGLATVVAASRVHVRIHHASDVVAGAVVGASLGHLARRLWPVPPVSG
ncbi:MAG: phosphatase PAP2 family protein [Acidimicrobiales bacterium]